MSCASHLRKYIKRPESVQLRFYRQSPLRRGWLGVRGGALPLTAPQTCRFYLHGPAFGGGRILGQACLPRQLGACPVNSGPARSIRGLTPITPYCNKYDYPLLNHPSSIYLANPHPSSRLRREVTNPPLRVCGCGSPRCRRSRLGVRGAGGKSLAP